MLAPPLQNALLFSINSIFNVYISIVLFRVILQQARVDAYNPIVRFTVQATDPLIIPISKLLPAAGIILAILLQSLELSLFLLIKGFSIPLNLTSICGLVLWGLGELIDLGLLIILIMVVIRTVISWIAPTSYSPASALIIQITEPILRPIRNLIPSFNMVDFSPMLLIFACMLCRILIADYLTVLGQSLL